MSLASKCMEPAFRMHLRAHSTVAKFFQALKDAPTKAVCLFIHGICYGKEDKMIICFQCFSECRIVYLLYHVRTDPGPTQHGFRSR